SIGDNTVPNTASGEVRAYDARRGRLLWSWDAIPQDASDPAYGEWRGDAAHDGGGANAWSGLAADAERDLVFVPTGSAAPDYYGGLRLGDNRYASSLVALRASTGKLVWSFQTVHHDLWDYDNASPPALVTLRRDGRSVDAVVLTTKTGMMFVLNRETGTPIFPVEERAVPASDVQGGRCRGFDFGRGEMERAARLVRRRADARGRGASAGQLGLAEPRRADRHGRRLGVHRRLARSTPTRLRHRDRRRALARRAA